MLQTHTLPNTSMFALIALGSNVSSPWGDPTETVQKAISDVMDRLGSGGMQSPLYSTPAFPAGAGPDFVNAAIRVSTDLTAQDVLTVLHETEAKAARMRTLRWGQRTLDLDLIALGDQVCPDLLTYSHWRDLAPDLQAQTAPDQLILPHPRVQDRSFVLVPLADVAPDWVHPVLGQSVVQMRDARPADEVSSVVRL
ncbi:MAG: 2-amino-4-hydroxy-6-hydroxymethyldihydropteridine diphosphokinase [Yoonia sp.]|jgi:2-amino-4-hydroxy-6-hydroxymethyldihydropteridine diphosphokinase